jgi:hypothetical protein
VSKNRPTTPKRGTTDEDIIRIVAEYGPTHETEQIFSGYGLTMQSGSKEFLAGLLMVDRPKPADTEVLALVRLSNAPKVSGSRVRQQALSGYRQLGLRMHC